MRWRKMRDVALLNERYRNHAATEVLRHAMSDEAVGRIALVSSFGAESVVLLHMVSVIRKDLPVLFIDTEMLFKETLEYQRAVSEKLGLTNVKTIRQDASRILSEDPSGDLHKSDPDACCDLRKTDVLEEALKPYDAWITGRKRFHGAMRAGVDFFEAETPVRMKINPLAHWRREDVQEYIEENALPRHPLVARGYPSIGCAPCTSPVKEGEDVRAGRWKGTDKTECGIHFVNGKMIRAGEAG